MGLAENTCERIWAANSIYQRQGASQGEYQSGGIRFWNNFDEMWSGCKDMIFWSVNRHIRWVRCKIHVTGYDEQMR